MKKAVIQYHKDFPPFGEGYAVKILIDGVWEFESFFALQHGIMDTIDDERNFIHFGLIDKIRQLQRLNYYVQIY